MREYKERNHQDTLRRGLKQVHIGQDVWLFGKQKQVPGKGLHMVIYGPDRKEYHVWNKDVEKLCTEYNEYEKTFLRGSVNRNGNRAINSKVKIHILTSILDDVKNWCFDLSQIPENGPLKVIYENGTVRNIKFNGDFLPEELISRRFTWEKEKNPVLYWPKYSFCSRGEMVKPVAYRIKQ